jgi:ABC-type sugar transport system substrate-binding protein
MLRNFLGLVAVCVLVGCGNEPGPPPAASDSNVTGAAASDSPNAGGGDDSGVVLLRYNPGSESTTKREEGFLAGLKEFPEINVISSDQYSGTSLDSSKTAADTILLRFGKRVEGLFAVCEPNAEGALEALASADRTSDVVFIGFDPNEKMVDALADNRMQGIVLQDPVTMGYKAVKTMVAHLNGEKVEKRISTGEFMATPENVNSKEMAKLLSPKQFSGTPPEVKSPKYTIAVLPKGLTHEFWLSVRFGAQMAADEIGGIKILWDGPAGEAKVAEQIKLVQNFVAQKVDGICLAPNDSTGLAPAVREAKEAGVPTVIFDSGLDTDEDDYVSYVATDNFVGGQLAGRLMGELLTKKKAE